MMKSLAPEVLDMAAESAHWNTLTVASQFT
jgi:hypothetical protein